MKFWCKCYSQQNQIVELEINAIHEENAKASLAQQGLIPLSIKSRNDFKIKTESRNGRFSLLLFSHELQTLLKAGLSLMEAIETLHEKEIRTNSKVVTEKLIHDLYEGSSLSSALELQSHIFPPLFIAMIRASEKTGELVETLSNYVRYRTQIDSVRKKIISASIYPIILMSVGLLVILFLMLYVVPKFSAIYESKNTDLPWMSELLLLWGRTLHDHAPITVASISVFLLGFALTITRPLVRKKIFKLLLSLPTLDEKFKIYALSRFYRSTGMLLKGGIPIVTSLEMTASVLNQNMLNQLHAAICDIKDGKPISVAMENNALSTPVALRMLRVGERSGEMGEMMLFISEFFDDDIGRWLDWFTKLFEPILMALIGLIVGAIVVLMYMPIFELAGSIQ